MGSGGLNGVVLLPYSEVEERFTGEELQTLREAFGRLCPAQQQQQGAGEKLATMYAIRFMIVSAMPLIPRDVTAALLCVFDAQNRHAVSFEDFSCAMTVLLKGSKAERASSSSISAHTGRDP